VHHQIVARCGLHGNGRASHFGLANRAQRRAASGHAPHGIADASNWYSGESLNQRRADCGSIGANAKANRHVFSPNIRDAKHAGLRLVCRHVREKI